MSQQSSLSQNHSLRYDAAFKRRAVEQVLFHHCSIAQVARQLDCSPQSVKNWIDRHHESNSVNPVALTGSIVSSPSSSSSKTPVSPAAFLPLHIDDLPIPTVAKIEIVTLKGLTLRFPVDTPSETLIGVVRQLEVVPC